MITGKGGTTDRNSLPVDWVPALFENREASILEGTANAGIARLSEHPLPLRRYRRRQGASGRFGRN